MLKFYWDHYFNFSKAKDVWEACFRGALIGMIVSYFIAIIHLILEKV